jgi:adenosylcobinamide-GDP ribazoletransferase
VTAGSEPPIDRYLSLSELGSALRFLTILPLDSTRRIFVGGRREHSPVAGRVFFPAVGILLGAFAWCGFWLGSTVIDSPMGGVAAVALLAASTGALHLDGLADAADGLLGHADRDRRLEIMRDSRVGSFGLVAVVLVLVGDVVALGGMKTDEALPALLTAASLARLSMLLVALTLPYARPAGEGRGLAVGSRLRVAVLATSMAALPLALDWRHGLLAVGLVALTAMAVAAWARRQIGGATGDVYGAVLELSQLAAITAFAVRL